MLAQAMVMIGLYCTGLFIVRRATKSGVLRVAVQMTARLKPCARRVPRLIKDPWSLGKTGWERRGSATLCQNPTLSHARWP